MEIWTKLKHCASAERMYFIFFWLLVTMSFFLVSITANDGSLWLDELASLYVNSPSLFLEPAREAQMPLFYVILFFCRLLFGTNEFSVRLPSMLCGLLLFCTLPWLLQRRGVPRLPSLLPSFGLLLVPNLLYYSHEGRAYMVFLLLGTTWAITRQELRARHPLWGIGLCWLFLASNTFAVAYVGLTLLFDGFFWWKKRGLFPRSEFWALVGYLPLLANLLLRTRGSSYTHNYSSSSWVQLATNGKWDLFTDGWNYFFGHAPWIFGALTFLALSAVFYLAWKKKEGAWLCLLLGLVFWGRFVPVVGWAFFERYLIFFVPLIFVPTLLALAPKLQRRPSLWFASGMVVLFLSAASSVRGPQQTKPWPGLVTSAYSGFVETLQNPDRVDWNAMIRYLDTVAQEGESFRFEGCGQCLHDPFDYYAASTRVAKTMKLVAGQSCTDWMMRQGPAVPDTLERCQWVLRGTFAGNFYLYGKSAPGQRAYEWRASSALSAK